MHYLIVPDLKVINIFLIFVPMIIVRDKSLDTKVKCDTFIDVITDDTAIAILKYDDKHYTQSLNVSNIKTGLTKQDNQYYYFDHDIWSSKYSKTKNFAYKVFPVTDDIADRIINEEFVSIWEVFFNSFVNYQTIYLMVRDYDTTSLYKYTGYIDVDKLTIPHGVSPSDMRDNQTIAEFFYQNERRYRYNETLPLNIPVIREIKLKELFS